MSNNCAYRGWTGEPGPPNFGINEKNFFLPTNAQLLFASDNVLTVSLVLCAKLGKPFTGVLFFPNTHSDSNHWGSLYPIPLAQGVTNSKLKEKTSQLKVKTQALDNFIMDSSFFLQIKWIFSWYYNFQPFLQRLYSCFIKKWTNILENLDLCLILKEKT